MDTVESWGGLGLSVVDPFEGIFPDGGKLAFA